MLRGKKTASLVHAGKINSLSRTMELPWLIRNLQNQRTKCIYLARPPTAWICCTRHHYGPLGWPYSGVTRGQGQLNPEGKNKQKNHTLLQLPDKQQLQATTLFPSCYSLFVLNCVKCFTARKLGSLSYRTGPCWLRKLAKHRQCARGIQRAEATLPWREGTQ